MKKETGYKPASASHSQTAISPRFKVLLFGALPVLWLCVCAWYMDLEWDTAAARGLLGEFAESGFGMRVQWLWGFVAGVGSVFGLGSVDVGRSGFNAPPGVETWCGKAYKASNASFNPGGVLSEPPRSATPLLDLKVYSRMSIYTEADSAASVVVDAAVSYIRGIPLDLPTGGTLSVQISVSDAVGAVVSNRSLEIDSTANEFAFSLEGVPARFEPYNVTLKARARARAGSGSYETFYASNSLYVLPKRTDGGSVVKVDRLFGGLWVNEFTSKGKDSWEPLLPYSYYISWGGWLKNSTENLVKLKNAGYNMIHAVPPIEYDIFDKFIAKCDELGLWVMYDMRWTYQNATALAEQVNRYKSHKSMLLWYTADEPDGTSEALSAPKTAYEQLTKLDPWHPVSLVLNCANFHYTEYSSGADIILQDAYPVGINATYSTVWSTPCNTTYGDCGCDNCFSSDLTEIPTRLDALATYQRWLGQTPKPLWTVPQAFGNESYWPRFPTPDEEVAMVMLSVNHNAKGVVGWLYPTHADIDAATSALARILSSPPVSTLLLNANAAPLTAKASGALVDAAAWEGNGRMLLSVVNSDTTSTDGSVVVNTPRKIKSIESVVRGTVGDWAVLEGGQGLVVKRGMGGLRADMVIVRLGD